ncbi:MAG: ABC transporter permease [Nonomuraea sp.]|nr:ABC transporter permease [Nonomuraea sp.]
MILANVIITPGFLSIEIKDGHLYGNLVDIMLRGAPLILLALGMTTVIATGGIDLSVGAVVAISGALACFLISGGYGVAAATAAALALCAVLGLWNGILVARIGIQPIIATLILMVAGRGLAQLITSGKILTVNSGAFHLIGGGYWGVPVAIVITGVVFGLTALAVRGTALGMMLEAVGDNAEAARLVGVRSRRLIVLAYVFSGLCAGVAGLMISSNISAADGNNAGLWMELDAILAVVIGGTPLTGGRFTLVGTALGALIIQTLSTTIYTVGIPSHRVLVFKAIVVALVCLIQSPAFRAKVRLRRKRPAAAVSRKDRVSVS